MKFWPLQISLEFLVTMRELIGYQRAEVERHIRDITDYLNGDDVCFQTLSY